MERMILSSRTEGPIYYFNRRQSDGRREATLFALDVYSGVSIECQTLLSDTKSPPKMLYAIAKNNFQAKGLLSQLSNSAYFVS